MSSFNSEPAAFSQTSTTETTGISIFEYLIDHSRIKSFINKHDKIPNHDGHLELTNEKNVPVGTIQVQMKILEDKDLDTPKYQCDRKFLTFCEQSILPVVIFAVHINSEQVFWHHVDKKTLKELAHII